jgi:hypothetical protein
MKSNLILKKFSVNSVPGTMSQKELRTFFGGKIIYSEDNISVNDDSIKYSQVVSDYNNGYQYYDINTIPGGWETDFNENLTDLKNKNQNITLYNQTASEVNNNTRWQINISASNILRDYLFYKIKEQRVFKVIKENDIYSNNINNAIYEYINKNIFSRYRLNKVIFYVSYYDIQQQTVYNPISLQYNPKFDVSVYTAANITNINISGYDPYKFDNVTILYNQSKPSDQFGFNYYFDLNFTKI